MSDGHKTLLHVVLLNRQRGQFRLCVKSVGVIYSCKLVGILVLSLIHVPYTYQCMCILFTIIKLTNLTDEL